MNPIRQEDTYEFVKSQESQQNPPSIPLAIQVIGSSIPIPTCTIASHEQRVVVDEGLVQSFLNLLESKENSALEKNFEILVEKLPAQLDERQKLFLSNRIQQLVGTNKLNDYFFNGMFNLLLKKSHHFPELRALLVAMFSKTRKAVGFSLFALFHNIFEKISGGNSKSCSVYDEPEEITLSDMLDEFYKKYQIDTKAFSILNEQPLRGFSIFTHDKLLNLDDKVIHCVLKQAQLERQKNEDSEKVAAFLKNLSRAKDLAFINQCLELHAENVESFILEKGSQMTKLEGHLLAAALYLPTTLTAHFTKTFETINKKYKSELFQLLAAKTSERVETLKEFSALTPEDANKWCFSFPNKMAMIKECATMVQETLTLQTLHKMPLEVKTLLRSFARKAWKGVEINSLLYKISASFIHAGCALEKLEPLLETIEHLKTTISKKAPIQPNEVAEIAIKQVQEIKKSLDTNDAFKNLYLIIRFPKIRFTKYFIEAIEDELSFLGCINRFILTDGHYKVLETKKCKNFLNAVVLHVEDREVKRAAETLLGKIESKKLADEISKSWNPKASFVENFKLVTARIETEITSPLIEALQPQLKSLMQLKFRRSEATEYYKILSSKNALRTLNLICECYKMTNPGLSDAASQILLYISKKTARINREAIDLQWDQKISFLENLQLINKLPIDAITLHLLEELMPRLKEFWIVRIDQIRFEDFEMLLHENMQTIFTLMTMLFEKDNLNFKQIGEQFLNLTKNYKALQGQSTFTLPVQRSNQQNYYRCFNFESLERLNKEWQLNFEARLARKLQTSDKPEQECRDAMVKFYNAVVNKAAFDLRKFMAFSPEIQKDTMQDCLIGSEIELQSLAENNDSLVDAAHDFYNFGLISKLNYFCKVNSNEGLKDCTASGLTPLLLISPPGSSDDSLENLCPLINYFQGSTIPTIVCSKDQPVTLDLSLTSVWKQKIADKLGIFFASPNDEKFSEGEEEAGYANCLITHSFMKTGLYFFRIKYAIDLYMPVFAFVGE